MAKSPSKNDFDEPAEVETHDKKGKDAKTEVYPHTQAEPYPTGNPQPTPTFEELHPQEARMQAEAEEAEKAAAKSKAKEK
jgi:hypothetical protein